MRPARQRQKECLRLVSVTWLSEQPPVAGDDSVGPDHQPLLQSGGDLSGLGQRQRHA
jgi:hypothetical protein